MKTRIENLESERKAIAIGIAECASNFLSMFNSKVRITTNSDCFVLKQRWFVLFRYSQARSIKFSFFSDRP